ncbi:MAG: GNAT family N-acetyltransferase [Novosphingobium sp.]
MNLPAWHEEPIAKSHDRRGFDCGDADLNTYLQKHARQNHEAGGSKTFCAIDDADPKRVLGFYSLAPISVGHDPLPETVTKGLPQHDVGGYLLARLATSQDLQGQGLGGQLLLAAGKRCLRVAAEAGGVFLLIDAKRERAASWYESYGAERLKDMPLKLVISLATIRDTLEAAGKF